MTTNCRFRDFLNKYGRCVYFFGRISNKIQRDERDLDYFGDWKIIILYQKRLPTVPVLIYGESYWILITKLKYYQNFLLGKLQYLVIYKTLPNEVFDLQHWYKCLDPNILYIVFRPRNNVLHAQKRIFGLSSKLVVLEQIKWKRGPPRVHPLGCNPEGYKLVCDLKDLTPHGWAKKRSKFPICVV